MNARSIINVIMLLNVAVIAAITSGCSENEVTAPDVAPRADFYALPVTGEAPLAVVFENLSSDFENSVWDFGDGGGSEARHPQHVYDRPGYYTVSLAVRGVGGDDVRILQDYIHVTAETKVISCEPPSTPVCQPGLVVGDCSFDAGGVSVLVTADLVVRADGRALWLELTMTADGVGDDDTHGYGERECLIYEAESGWTIAEVMSSASETIAYVDDDNFAEVFEQDMGRFEVMGQTFGLDLCGLERTQVDVDLATITLRLSRES